MTKTSDSGTSAGRLAKPLSIGGVLISVLLAAVLVGGVTVVRALLNPWLGAHSPLMLYVLAVPVAGFARGGLCGLLVMFGGGLVGEYLFAAPHNGLSLNSATIVSLLVFWTVSLPVLGMSLELARRANEVLDRLQLDPRREPPPGH